MAILTYLLSLGPVTIPTTTEKANLSPRFATPQQQTPRPVGQAAAEMQVPLLPTPNYAWGDRYG